MMEMTGCIFLQAYSKAIIKNVEKQYLQATYERMPIPTLQYATSQMFQ